MWPIKCCKVKSHLLHSLIQDLTLSHSLCSSHTVLLSVLQFPTQSIKNKKTKGMGGWISRSTIQLSGALDKVIWKWTETINIFKRSNRRKIPRPGGGKKRVKLPFTFSIISASSRVGCSAFILVLLFPAVSFLQIICCSMDEGLS